jgi:N,N'-diacetyllegionaminate synthase
MTIEIAGAGKRFTIGDGSRCFVIAEAGVNHNGDVQLAKELVDAAVYAGADAVKFQTWRTDKLVERGAPLAEYQRLTASDVADQFELLRSLELGEQGFVDIAAHAADRGIMFLSTPDEEDSADFLEGLGVPLFKIGSAEVTNLPLLRHVAQKGKTIILSTGMSTLAEVADAVDVLESAGARDLVLLHCVSSYPSAPQDSNLKAMETMRVAFGHPVGFSDHTLGAEVALAAVALGASVLEKHLTVSVALDGPDHRSSLEPEAFARYVEAVRLVEAALGDGRKRPTAEEQETKQAVRRRVLAGRDIAAGALLGEEDLILRRAGAGALAEEVPLLVGRRLTRQIATGEPIALHDVQ